MEVCQAEQTTNTLLICGKTQDQVRKLIAGTDNVYICDDCIELCSEILEEEFADQEKDRISAESTC